MGLIYSTLVSVMVVCKLHLQYGYMNAINSYVLVTRPLYFLPPSLSHAFMLM